MVSVFVTSAEMSSEGVARVTLRVVDDETSVDTEFVLGVSLWDEVGNETRTQAAQYELAVRLGMEQLERILRSATVSLSAELSSSGIFRLIEEEE